MSTVTVAVIASLLAIGSAIRLYLKVQGAATSTDEANSIATNIAEGATAFLSRQYRTVAMVGAPICLILAIFFGKWYAIGFLLGAFASAAAGFIGMNVSVRANVRVAAAASHGFSRAFGLAFEGGAVTGLMVVGLGLLTISVLVGISGEGAKDGIIGLAFGGSLISVFARLGGGIFTKAADVGADLVGKVEANIPEDDPRNPATIADNVGDNVGDCAGMAADLFETYGVTAAASMLMAHIIFPDNHDMFIYPLAVGVAGILGSIVSIPFVSIPEPPEGQQPAVMGAMYKGLGIATVVMLGIMVIANFMFDIPAEDATGQSLGAVSLWFCSVIGAIVTGIMLWITDYYTGDGSPEVAKIAEASEGGHGTNVISGLAVGLHSTVVPVLVIALAIITCNSLAGIYGVGIAAMAMLSLAGLIVSIDAYGPITDNAGGIAEMAKLGEDVRNVTDPLDAFGNTTKAVTKGYAIASAGLAAVVLFATFIADLEAISGVSLSFDLANPSVLAGLFIGAMMPFIFASYAMEAVGVAAKMVVQEVRRQFKEMPGIMDGTQKPEYGKCVDLVTSAALKGMIKPALIPIAVPIVVAIVPGLGALAIGGLLIGSIVSGVCMGVSMTVGGAAWDNAKKFIEMGAHGGKGSDAHKAAVTGDTVGDPYKDTAGPAINPMLKLVNITALLLVPFL